jgi:hypothetical protein
VTSHSLVLSQPSHSLVDEYGVVKRVMRSVFLPSAFTRLGFLSFRMGTFQKYVSLYELTSTVLAPHCLVLISILCPSVTAPFNLPWLCVGSPQFLLLQGQCHFHPRCWLGVCLPPIAISIPERPSFPLGVRPSSRQFALGIALQAAELRSIARTS